MCLISFSWQQHSEYPLVLAANRDEFYARETRPMQFWQPDNNILAGKDMVAGGTWMGFHKNGRFSALTNIRDPAYFKPGQHSRGDLIIDFLNSDLSVKDWGDKLATTYKKFHGFNLIFGDQRELFYFGSHQPVVRLLESGLYGLCNADLDTPWPKVELAKQQLKDWLTQPNLSNLANLHSGTDLADDNLLPVTGVPIKFERSLSAQKIVLAEYGTRAQTGLIITRSGTLKVTEINIDTDAVQQFTIEDFWKDVSHGANGLE